MKKNLTEIVFILDRSGSMAGLEDYNKRGKQCSLNNPIQTKRAAGTDSCSGSPIFLSPKYIA